MIEEYWSYGQGCVALVDPNLPMRSGLPPVSQSEGWAFGW